MISIVRRFEFEAAHFLPAHQGKCKRIHGHTYKIEVEISAPSNMNYFRNGMLMDFGELGQIVKDAVIERFDHHILNEKMPESFLPPTAEMLCIFMAGVISGFVPDPMHLSRVRVQETSNCYAEWRADGR